MIDGAWRNTAALLSDWLSKADQARLYVHDPNGGVKEIDLSIPGP
jgi:hypothetical protein